MVQVPSVALTTAVVKSVAVDELKDIKKVEKVLKKNFNKFANI